MKETELTASFHLVRKPLTTDPNGDWHQSAYRWVVTLTVTTETSKKQVEVDYSTGCGWFEGPDKPPDRARYGLIDGARVAAGLGDQGLPSHIARRYQPKRPTLADICYSLHSDWDVGQGSFRDFCSDFAPDDAADADAHDTWSACVRQLERLQAAGITQSLLARHFPEDY